MKNVSDCTRLRGDKLIQCIENNSYSAKNLNLSFSPKTSVNVKHFYANRQYAMVQNLEIKPNVIQYNYPHSTLKIRMEKGLHYLIAIMDPKLNFFTGSSPDLFPRLLLNWKPKGEENMLIYMKVHTCVLYLCKY